MKHYFLILCCVFTCLAVQSHALIDHQSEIDHLHLVLSKSLDTVDSTNKLAYKHVLKSVSDDGSLVAFEDDLSFTIDWWYRSTPKKWKAGDVIYVSYDFGYKEFKLEHMSTQEIAWGSIKLYLPLFLQSKKFPVAQVIQISMRN